MGVAMAAMAVASVAVGALQAQATYEEEAAFAKAQKKAVEEANDRMHAEAIRQYGQLSEGETLAIGDAFTKSIEAQKQHLIARSQIEAQAAATGTYGQSIDILLQDLETTKGQNMANILAEEEMRLDDSRKQAENIAANYEAQVNRTPISQPSAFKHVMGGASTALSTYSMMSGVYSSYQAAAPAATAPKSGANIKPS